jgi:hypothetical protein
MNMRKIVKITDHEATFLSFQIFLQILVFASIWEPENVDSEKGSKNLEHFCGKLYVIF